MITAQHQSERRVSEEQINTIKETYEKDTWKLEKITEAFTCLLHDLENLPNNKDYSIVQSLLYIGYKLMH